MPKRVKRNVKKYAPDSGILVTFTPNEQINLRMFARALIALAEQELDKKDRKTRHLKNNTSK